MKNIVTESFKVNIKMMIVLRWYPPENGLSLLNKIIGCLVYFGILVLPTILIIVDVFIQRSYTNMQFIIATETFNYSMKLLPFLTNGNRLKKCIEYFDGPYFAPRDKTEEEITEKCVWLCQTMSKTYIIVLAAAEFMAVVPFLFFKEYTLPVAMWLPYDATSGAIPYYATLIYLGGLWGYSGSATSLLDPLIGGLAYHATGQLKILKHRLQYCHGPDETFKKSAEDFNRKVIYWNLTKCIQYHNAILEFVDQYEDCFSWVMFSQFVGTTLGLCFCCLALTTVPLFSIDAAIYITFFSSIISQVFFYCYFGTVLFEENNTLVTAIYMSKWYEYDIKTRKILITMMERSKRPISITAAKFIDVTLETFLKMVKGSYSLIAVLK